MSIDGPGTVKRSREHAGIVVCVVFGKKWQTVLSYVCDRTVPRAGSSSTERSGVDIVVVSAIPIRIAKTFDQD